MPPASPVSSASPASPASPVEIKVPTKTKPPETGKQGQAEAANPGNEAVDKMGIGETKTFDADENPLEKKLDNLLDGVK